MKKSAVHLSRRDPKVRRAIEQSTKAFKEYAKAQARKLASVTSKIEGVRFGKIQEAVGKELAASANNVRFTSPKLVQFPRKPYITFVQPGPTLSADWVSVEIRKPPYDTDYQGYVIGYDVPIPPNGPKYGRALVDGGSGTPDIMPQAIDGNVDVQSGVVIAITSPSDASVFVQPHFNYGWQQFADGRNGCGNSQGGLEVVAWRNMSHIMPPQRVQLFSGQSCFGMNKVMGGAIGSLTIPINFQMKAGEVVVVDCGSWLHCDHSGQGVGWGSVDAYVDQIVIVKDLKR